MFTIVAPNHIKLNTSDLPRVDISLSELRTSSGLKSIIEKVKTDFAIFVTQDANVLFLPHFFQKFQSCFLEGNYPIIYSDYLKSQDSTHTTVKTIDYQAGSVRDDFVFGPVIGLNVKLAREALASLRSTERKFGALYELRLKLAEKALPLHMAELMYIIKPVVDNQNRHDEIFDYVDPSKRDVQIEFEDIFTHYCKRNNIFLPPCNKDTDLNAVNFSVDASVIIPVRNRVNTVGEAVLSALQQEFNGKFNVIVIDNFSTDGTSEKIDEIALKYPNLIRITPLTQGLGIGGCWNLGILSKDCGKFAIQLDSDDLYIDNKVISKIVDKFYLEKSAALVGSYKLVNFNLEDIPPGLIDHKEWTPENGHNNALRINGLGAPRAFYTPIIRDTLFRNVSYGEDYAAMLRICREYKIARIYEPLYLCRRWEGNSEAVASAEQMNAHNFFKDSIRTNEIAARIRINHEGLR